MSCESRKKGLYATRHSNETDIHGNCHIADDFKSSLKETMEEIHESHYLKR